MVYIRVYQKLIDKTAHEVSHAFLQAGIYLDRMTASNLVENVEVINHYLDYAYAHYMSTHDWIEDEVKKRKATDRTVLEILQEFKKIGNMILLFERAVSETVSEFKKRELEIPGERKRIEDEKLVRIFKKNLKERYNKLDYYLEPGDLLGQYKEIGEALFQPELQLPELRQMLASIQSYLGRNYQEMNKEALIADIDIYIKDLTDFSKIISKEFDAVLVNILGEIGIWKNIRKNFSQITPYNYNDMVAQLLALIHDTDKTFKQIEAA